MRKDNVFRFGGEVSGESFFGRTAILQELVKNVRPGSGCQAVSVIGLNRIGKSSLVKRLIQQEFDGKPEIIVLQTSMERNTCANEFWNELLCMLEEELSINKICDEEIQRVFVRLAEISLEDSRWYTNFKLGLRTILICLKKHGYRVVLVIDEFDQARELFKNNYGGIGLIRNLASSSELPTTVITLSRRRLYMIEGKMTKFTSTLEGVFDSKYVVAFDDADMDCYLDALSWYDIYPEEDEALMQKLTELAGRQPYLLCLYGNRMADYAISGAEVTADTVEQIHKDDYGRNIVSYYDSVYHRMKEDGYADKLLGILMNVMYGVRESDVEVLQGCGYLTQGEDGWYLLSREFTRYFLEQSKELRLPALDEIMNTEKLLKEKVKQVYPILSELCYSDIKSKMAWSAEIRQRNPELYIQERKVQPNMRKAYEEYGQDSCVADALELRYVVEGIIQPNWDKFRHYFKNQDKSEWEPHLKLLVRARIPLAHAHSDYLTEQEEQQLHLYCQQLQEVLKK